MSNDTGEGNFMGHTTSLLENGILSVLLFVPTSIFTNLSPSFLPDRTQQYFSILPNACTERKNLRCGED